MDACGNQRGSIRRAECLNMAEWNTLVSWGATGTETGWSFRTGRIRIAPSVVGISAGKIRLTFKGGVGRTVIPSVFVGIEKLPIVTYGGMMFDAPPVRVTFGGNNGFDIGQGETIISDEISIDYDVTLGKGLIVSFFAPTALGANYVEYGYTDAINGVYTKFMNGPDNAGAMQHEFSSTPAFIFASHRVYGFTGVEIVAKDEITTPPTGEITSAGGTFITSADEVFIAGQLNVMPEIIGTNFSFNYSVNYGARVSKASLYAITRVRDRLVSKASVYTVTSSNLSLYFDFDYYIGNIDVPFTFDYGVVISRDYGFTYSVLGAVAQTFTFDYDIAAAVVDYAFNYRILSGVVSSFTFNYSIIEVVRDYTFDYNINYVPPRPITVSYVFDYAIDKPTLPFLFVPEIPIDEVWSYVTSIAKNYDGTEQRSALREEPSIVLTYEYVFDTERTDLYKEIYNNIRGTMALPIFAYAAITKAETVQGATLIAVIPAHGDLRPGDDVFCMAPDETYSLGRIDSVGTDFVSLEAGVSIRLPVGSWVVPMRDTYIADGNGISMRSIEGRASVAYATATRRAIKRPTATNGLVPTYDGVPILALRPLADDDVDEMFNGNAVRITDAVDVDVTTFATWKMPTIDGARSYLVNRPGDMDFWREWADTVKGRRGSFLVPTFRADLVPVSVAGATLRVKGVHFSAWAKHDAYSRLQIETSEGVQLRKVMAAVRDGSETVIALDSPIAGVVEKVSFLNRVRLSSDNISWQHIETRSIVTIEIVTVNE